MVELTDFNLPITNHGADDDNILKWTIRVDDHIDTESLDIMKLGMRGELTQTERDAAYQPSDLYHALVKHYEPPVALARFVYALERLGHRRHGHRAANELSKFFISKPDQFNPAANMTEDNLEAFLLHQSLVDVLVHLEEEYYPKIIPHFAKTCLRGINPNTIDSPCALFTQMLERGVITKTNTDRLVEGLRKMGDNKSASRVHRLRHSHDGDQISIDLSTSSETSSQTEPESLLDNKGDFECEGHKQSNDNIRKKQKTKCRGHTFITCVCLPLTVASMLLYGLALYFPLSMIVAEDNRLILLHSNSMVILYDNDHDSSGVLRVTEDTGHPGDFDHKIILYRIDSECSDLSVKEEAHKLAGTNFSLINGTTIYTLAGSSMTYNICGSTNSTYQSERLELVFLDELEDLQSPLTGYHKFYYFPHGTHGNWECNQVTYNINKDGYYTPIFLTEPREVTFAFTVTFQLRLIPALSLPHYMLTANKEFVEISLTQHQCVVAFIHENPNIPSPYVHVQISYKYYMYYREHPLPLSLLLLSFIVFSMSCCSCILGCVIRHC